MSNDFVMLFHILLIIHPFEHQTNITFHLVLFHISDYHLNKNYLLFHIILSYLELFPQIIYYIFH